MQSIEEQLKGGHHNSLGNTVQVVEQVLAEHELFDELFTCYFSNDELVRLRVSNAMKRIAKESPQLLYPYIDRFLNEVAKINQASTQWTLAQLFILLEKQLSPEQKEKATALMKTNLEEHKDWIVLNTTMESLSKWSKQNPELKSWLLPHLQCLSKDGRKSVAKRAVKFLAEIRK